jgi:hypothetical protein
MNEDVVASPNPIERESNSFREARSVPKGNVLKRSR